MIKPFKVNVSEDILKEINNKVKNYPWHEMPRDGGWEYGTNLDYMKEISITGLLNLIGKNMKKK